MDPEQIESLRKPDVFPGNPETVEILQTHLSIVCLAGNLAYKLKKSIRLPFADFSTPERRKYFCDEELRLNRRLCPGIYLEVVPLRQQGEGRLSFCPENGGETIDHAVKMRRLPAHRMLDCLLETEAVSREDIRRVSTRMVAFHREADRGVEVRDWGSPERLRGFALANFEETRDAIGPVYPPALHEALESRARADFERWLPVLERRAREGCVVDGHGDLHARNICLTDPPSIYDCIEFSPGLRCGDVATEHAFLVMDLRFRGHRDLADAYLDEVILESGDSEMRALMPPLVRYRAMVRAKVSSIAAGESELPEGHRTEARETARRYLRLAAASRMEENGPWWLILCGLPASGKSGIAAALSRAGAGAWPIFSSDRIRKELAGVAPTDPLPAQFYEPGFSRRTYEELRSRASVACPRSGVILLDANFRGREERILTARAAAHAGARLAILRIEVDEATVVARLDRRSGDPSSVSDANEAVYQKLKAEFEPPDAGEGDLLIPVDGKASPESAADDALAALIRA